MNNKEENWFQNLTNLIVGKYKLQEYIGKGKIGYVYKANHTQFTNSYRAIKLIFDSLNPGWQTEIQKVFKLDLIDNVVHIHDLGSESLTYEGITHLAQYTVWDYIPPGRDLGKYLKEYGNVTVSFLIAVIEQILKVLHACEIEGVSRHGDLHPGNVLIGKPSSSKLDDRGQPRAPIYISDFGYGATGIGPLPKDDYKGLINIINTIIKYIDHSKTSATDRQLIEGIRKNLGKLLKEEFSIERRNPIECLQLLIELRKTIQAGTSIKTIEQEESDNGQDTHVEKRHVSNVGSFQVSEMIGENWDVWKQLFVPSVPARSAILDLNIPTVITGPRGCGKTMLFKRLSERLVVECDDYEDPKRYNSFVALYINANDFSDAFAHFPKNPKSKEQKQLICYANLCVLSDALSVESARTGKGKEISHDFLSFIQDLFFSPMQKALIEGEDRLENYRAFIEEIKWHFPSNINSEIFPGFNQLSQHRWLPMFFKKMKELCHWIEGRPILLFIDDYSIPRVSESMQRVLNRLFLQRSSNFLVKISTEAITTFVPLDSSDKNLEDGDDYQLIDIGTESLFLEESERLIFLENVFSRRLSFDRRIPDDKQSLLELLGKTGLSKTEFARRLRSKGEQSAVPGDSQRRGVTRPRILYFGEDVFSCLWSGDTRFMIQLISLIVDQASGILLTGTEKRDIIKLPVESEFQDRVFRDRGSEWLSGHARNQPTNPAVVRAELKKIRKNNNEYSFTGEYGDHLKAIVESFVYTARKLLHGPPYLMASSNYIEGTFREVPRQAFRIEVLDDFRIDGLTQEIYRDLIRYGLFIRDDRGKSVRGAFVPRLFLRKLLIPYAVLALSKKDSVQLKCDEFIKLLLYPDKFKTEFRIPVVISPNQINIFDNGRSKPDDYNDYNDLEEDNFNNESEVNI